MERSCAGHLDGFLFYGPVRWNFLGEVRDSRQQLYIASLSWITAGRSHADGDLVLAIVLGSGGPRIFELQGGGSDVRPLRLAGARQDLIITEPVWSGQGETQRGLAIFALSN